MAISVPPKGVSSRGVNSIRATSTLEDTDYSDTAVFPRLALVTGATSGIGAAFSDLLQKKGVEVIATGRNQEKLDQFKGKSIQCNLEKDRSELVNWINEETPDLVVNNAGFGFYGKGAEIPIQEQLSMVEVNNKALLEITLAAVNALLRKGKKGVILNVASAAAFQPFPSFAVYAATKAFVVNLSESLDQELSSRGIRVLVSCPGRVKTDFQNRASKGKPSRKNQFMTPEYAARRLWKQVIKEKRVDIFDWKYHLLVRLGQFLIPNRYIGSFLKRFIKL